MKKVLLGLLVALVIASPVSARTRPFITVNQGERIIFGDWFTVSYAGSDYARAYCTQDGVQVWNELLYLPGEGGPIQITPVIEYRPTTTTPCVINLVKISKGGRERVIATDTFGVFAPV